MIWAIVGHFPDRNAGDTELYKEPWQCQQYIITSPDSHLSQWWLERGMPLAELALAFWSFLLSFSGSGWVLQFLYLCIQGEKCYDTGQAWMYLAFCHSVGILASACYITLGKKVGTHLPKNSHFRETVHRQSTISTRGPFKLSREVSKELQYIKKYEAILQREETRLLSHPRIGFNHY